MNRVACVFLVFFLAVSNFAFAQNPGTGLYAFGSFDSKGFDSINLGNLNTHFEIPIVNKQGRGLNFTYSMIYDGLIWSTSTTAGVSSWVPDPAWGFRGQLLGGAYTGYLTYHAVTFNCTPDAPPTIPPHPVNNATIYSNYVYHDPFGKQHPFSYMRTICSGVVTTSGNGASSDGEGYTFVGYKVHTRNQTILTVPAYNVGASYSSSTSSKIDANGNTVTNNGNGTFTNTLGVTALTIGGSGTPASPLTLTYPVTLQANGATLPRPS